MQFNDEGEGNGARDTGCVGRGGGDRVSTGRCRPVGLENSAGGEREARYGDGWRSNRKEAVRSGAPNRSHGGHGGIRGPEGTAGDAARGNKQAARNVIREACGAGYRDGRGIGRSDRYRIGPIRVFGRCSGDRGDAAGGGESQALGQYAGGYRVCDASMNKIVVPHY